MVIQKKDKDSSILELCIKHSLKNFLIKIYIFYNYRNIVPKRIVT